MFGGHVPTSAARRPSGRVRRVGSILRMAGAASIGVRRTSSVRDLVGMCPESGKPSSASLLVHAAHLAVTRTQSPVQATVAVAGLKGPRSYSSSIPNVTANRSGGGRADDIRDFSGAEGL